MYYRVVMSKNTGLHVYIYISFVVSCKQGCAEENKYISQECLICTRVDSSHIHLYKKWTRKKTVNCRIEISKNTGVYIRVYLFCSRVKRVNSEEDSVFVKTGITHTRAIPPGYIPAQKVSTEQISDF